jgi:hypothetical protein
VVFIVALPVVPVVSVGVVIVGLARDGLPLRGGVEVGLGSIVDGGADDVSLVGATGAVGAGRTGLAVTAATPTVVGASPTASSPKPANIQDLRA